jgi:adenosine deaminase
VGIAALPKDSLERSAVLDYASLPKVELHRHLEGSLRLETLVEIAGEHGFELPGSDLTGLRSLVQIFEGEPFTHANFLSKFKTLRLFFRSPEVIARITHEAIADAAADRVIYLELRFTPVALSRIGGYSLQEVMGWVITSARTAAEEYGVDTRLIASTNRHESPALAEEVAQLAAEYLDDGVVGLDLAGDEVNFPALPFAGVFQEARQAGLRLTVHAGEWSGPENVIEAIEQLGAERIGHGVRVLENAAAVSLARERGTAFEVCLTSNYQSGVVSGIDRHPLPAMLAQGLNASIHTDDPSISRIALSDEYRLAGEVLGLSRTQLLDLVVGASQAAFLGGDERAELAARLRTGWTG